MKIKFNEKTISSLDIPAGKRQIKYWDTSQQGLGLVLTRRSDNTVNATYVFSRTRSNGTRQQEALGSRYEMTYAEAIQKVTVLNGNVVEGKLTPGEILRLSTAGPTVKEAIKSKLEKMEHDGARPSSMKSIRDELLNGRHLKAWHDRPLRSITPWDCRAMHQEIALAGKHSANRIMRNFGAVWTHIARESALLKNPWPDNPTTFVNWFSKNVPGFRKRRGEPIPWTELPAWKERVDALTNPYHKLLHYVLLLTGLRKSDALTLRWEHVNLTNEPIMIKVWSPSHSYRKRELEPYTVFRPCPKGGHDKAFDIPLPRYLVDLLKAHYTARKSEDNGWVFCGMKYKTAACSRCADLNLPKHERGVVCHITHVDESGRSPHRERDTYITATEELDPPMPEGIVQRLVNHSKRTVTEGYRRQSMENLRHWQEKQCAFLLSCMKREEKRHLTSVA